MRLAGSPYLALALGSALVVSCQQTTRHVYTSSEPVAAPSSTSGCTETFVPGSHPAEDIGRLARSCGSGMHPLTAVREATQHQDDPVDRYTFSSLQPGKCYRIYAIGYDGIRGLDVVVRNSEGRELATHDTFTPTRFPVVPAQAPLCMSQADDLTLEVGVNSGAGKYAVQVWQN